MSSSNAPIKDFRLDLSELTYTGHDLVRPESIIAQPNGTLWVSDGRGGVTRIDPDGQQQFFPMAISFCWMKKGQESLEMVFTSRTKFAWTPKRISSL